MANNANVSLQPLTGDSYPAGGPIDDYAVLEAPGRSLFSRGREEAPDQAKLTAPGRVLVALGGGNAYLDGPTRAYSLAGTVQVVGRLDHERGFKGSIFASGYTGNIGSAELEGIGRSIFAHGGGRAALTKSAGLIEASGTTGIVGSVDIYVPSHEGAGSGTVGNVGAASILAPTAKSLWGVARELQVPGIRVSASGYLVQTPTYRGYAVNISTGAVSEYENYQFDFVVRFQGKYYGCGTNGITLLEGADDRGTDIDASIEFHPTDFGSERQKRLPYVYVSTRMGSAQQMLVSAAPDEGVSRSALTTRQHRNRRAQLPRGVKGRYWTIKIENQNGADFDIDTIEPITEVLRRKL